MLSTLLPLAEELIGQYGSKDLMRVAFGGRGDPLGQRLGQGGLRDELPLSRDATSDAAATAQMLCPAPSAEYRRLSYASRVLEQ